MFDKREAFDNQNPAGVGGVVKVEKLKSSNSSKNKNKNKNSSTSILSNCLVCKIPWDR